MYWFIHNLMNYWQMVVCKQNTEQDIEMKEWGGLKSY